MPHCFCGWQINVYGNCSGPLALEISASHQYLQKYAKNIICYEPNKIHFTCLERNLAPYTHVTLQNQAIGNEDGFVRLSEEKATHNTRVLKEQGETIISKLDLISINKYILWNGIFFN